MIEPVVVIHGVANRDREEFVRKVADLQRRAGGSAEFLPVFWGDIGADADADVRDTLPRMDASDEKRQQAALAAAIMAGDRPDQQTVRAADAQQQIDAIMHGAAATAADVPDAAVRSADGQEALRRAVVDELPRTRNLQHMHDPLLLEALGRVLGQVASEPAAPGPSDGAMSVRGSDTRPNPWETGSAASVTRDWPDPGALARKVLPALDDLVGRLLDNALGTANQWLRNEAIQPISAFVGDIFAYQRNRARIHARIWQALDGWNAAHPGAAWGRDRAQPVNVVAHSLGGVVAFDAALDPADGNGPLWIKTLVTFGSQPAFFHVIDPRRRLPVYHHADPPRLVPLPPEIGRWINLWEPMDPLAFTAAGVFCLAGRKVPDDRKVATPASELLAAKGFTHGLYWTSDELVAALKTL